MLDPNPLPSEERRRAIFAALVEAQDRARSVHEAKQEVLAMFGVTWGIVERALRQRRPLPGSKVALPVAGGVSLAGVLILIGTVLH